MEILQQKNETYTFLFHRTERHCTAELNAMALFT